MENGTKTNNLLLNSKQDKDEFALINEFADLLQLPRATALKLFIREKLPGKITEIKSQAVCNSASVG